MPMLRIVMLLVTLAICYLLFFHSQPAPESQAANPLPPELAALSTPGASPATPHTRYKEAMDRAHAAAKAMQDERKEADAD